MAHLFQAVYSVLFGLLVGSYLNVVIHRLPRGASTVLPRSRCPHCGITIRARDNLPVVSFLLLRGRCRGCAAPISWRYPLVEVLTAGVFLLAYLHHGLSLAALATAAFGAALVALAAIDLEHFLLPDRITLPMTLAGLGLQPWLPEVGLRSALLGAAVGSWMLLVVIGLWYLVRGQMGMGLGDVKMLAMIGVFLGLGGVAVTLFAAFVTGAVVGLTLLLLGRGSISSRLPFGAFLAPAALFAAFWGPPVVDAYLALLV
jgi:leader peptidase (prepilin peptidase) / N-methyltransferase